MKNNLLSILFILTLLITACDQCKEVTCINGSSCEKGECQCLDGYSGDRCEMEDRCVTRDVNCQNGGSCKEGKCDCEEGFSGSNCQEEDLCITKDPNCKNGGVCDDGECDCPAGFSGDRCEIQDPVVVIGPCDTINCQNDQPCVDGSCICNSWTTGNRCQNKAIDQYIGTYSGDWGGDCSGNGSMEISAFNGDLQKLILTLSFPGGGFDLEVDFIDLQNFNIPSQEVDGYTYAGFGELSGGSWTVEVTENGSITCIFYEF